MSESLLRLNVKVSQPKPPEESAKAGSLFVLRKPPDSLGVQ